MFNKTNGSKNGAPAQPRQAGDTNAAADTRRAPPAVPSLLGPDLVFDGSISGDGELHVEGVVRGDLSVSRLCIGERARVEGKIHGGVVEIRGAVIGDIEARQVKLYDTAHVDGDIVHEQLSIDAGAFFQGRCQQFQRPVAQVIELDTSANQS